VQEVANSEFLKNFNSMNATTITMPLIREYAIEKRIRNSILIMIALCAFGYVYFVSTSVLNIIARKDAHNQISTLESTIGTLESEYYNLSSSISRNVASELGLVSLSSKSFVTRTSLHASANNSNNSGL
jgi:hypothetical protein